MRWVHRDVMLKAVVSDIGEKFLQARDFRNCPMPKRVELVIRSFAFADISADHASGVVCGETSVSQWSCWRAAFHGAERILHAKRAAENRRVGDFRIRRERLGPVAAV